MAYYSLLCIWDIVNGLMVNLNNPANISYKENGK